MGDGGGELGLTAQRYGVSFGGKENYMELVMLVVKTMNNKHHRLVYFKIMSFMKYISTNKLLTMQPYKM